MLTQEWFVSVYGSLILYCKTDFVQKDGSADAESVSASRELDAATIRFNAPIPEVQVAEDEDEELEHDARSVITNYVDDGLPVAEQAWAVTFRSSEILSDSQREFWSMSFCELFPFGRGGLRERRKTPIGLEAFVRHCLRLSSRRFLRHPTFLLVAFDVIARHRALQALHVTTRVSPDMALSAAVLTRDDLEKQLQYQEARLRAIRQHAALPPQPTLSGAVIDVKRGLDIGKRAYWGSSTERETARTNLFSSVSQRSSLLCPRRARAHCVLRTCPDTFQTKYWRPHQVSSTMSWAWQEAG